MTKKSALRFVLVLTLFLIAAGGAYLQAEVCYESCYSCFRQTWYVPVLQCEPSGNYCCEWDCLPPGSLNTITVLYCQAVGTCSWPAYAPCGRW